MNLILLSERDQASPQEPSSDPSIDTIYIDSQLLIEDVEKLASLFENVKSIKFF